MREFSPVDSKLHAPIAGAGRVPCAVLEKSTVVPYAKETDTKSSHALLASLLILYVERAVRRLEF